MLSPPNQDFYHPSVCHVCKSKTDLSICANCKSISYCSKTHQSANWPEHKKLCKLISYTDEMYTVEMQNQYQDQDVYLNLIKNELKKKLKRELYWYEIEMLIFRKYCAMCNVRNCPLGCQHCASVFYCSVEHQKEHSEKHLPFCGSLKLNLDILVSNFKTKINSFAMSDQHFKDDIKHLPATQIKMFSIICAENYLFFPRELEFLHTFIIVDVFAPILNILFGLERGMVLKDRMLPKKSLLVHIVGADQMELSWNWDFIFEFIFHWIKNLKKLTFILIGPELTRWSHSSSNQSNYCKTCQNNNINANCFTMTKYYHDVVNGLGRPDIIVAFNCGIFAASSWIPSIGSLTKFSGVPIVITDYTLTYLKDDLEAIKNCTKKEIQVVLFPQWNHYSCVSPERSFDIKNCPILHRNSYMTILMAQ